MFQRVRETLTLALVALLPFHALFVTVMTKIIAGPNHAPLSLLAAWKEGVLGAVMCVALVEMAWSKGQWKEKREKKKEKLDIFDCIVAVLLCIAMLLFFLQGSSLGSFLLGIRYDFVPLFAFLILRRVPWSEGFFQRAAKMLCITGVIACVFGFGIYIFSDDVYRVLGYSDLHSLYVPGGPLAPFQQLGESAVRRMQGSFSGPNQFGLWLLLPWSIMFVSVFRDLVQAKVPSYVRIVMLFIVTLGIILSFSRSAWMGLVVIAATALFLCVPTQLRKVFTLIIISCLAIATASVVLLFPHAVFRNISNRGHIERPIAAVQRIFAHPFGLGLGSAGPASNRMSDACVDLPEGSDASWAKNHPDLCVFVGKTQVQPADRTCSCPFLPENWYLQIGVELGLLGMLLWIVLVVLITKRLFAHIARASVFHSGVALAFLGVSIAALFLHAWEDSAVAYGVWVMMATVL
jgi:hypothetical protein